MKGLRIAAKECNYQELDRQVKEQFICGINDEYIQRKIDSEIKAISNTSEIIFKSRADRKKVETRKSMQIL